MTYNTTPLSNICKGGGSYGIAASAVEYSPLLPTYLRITDINDDGTLNNDGLKSVDDPNSAKYYLSPNDIVFARTGASTGRNYFYDGSDGEFVYAGFLIKFSLDPQKVNPLFVKYYCQSKNYYDWVGSFNTGSTRGNINAQTLGNMPIPVLPRDLQDLIADTLSALDAKIAENRKINHHLELIAQAIFKSWFVDFEPWVGEMPKTWKVKSLGEVCLNITDGVHSTVIDDPNGEYLLLSCKNIKNGSVVLSDKERRVSSETFHKLRVRTQLASGDILLTSVGTIGEMALLIDPPLNVEFQRSVAMIKPNPKFVSSSFLYVALMSQKEEIVHAAHGAVQQCLFIGDIKSFPILLPDIELISEYSTLVSPLFELIASNHLENSRLSSLRNSLLPRLLSGELSVIDLGHAE